MGSLVFGVRSDLRLYEAGGQMDLGSNGIGIQFGLGSNIFLRSYHIWGLMGFGAWGEHGIQ